VDHQRCRTTTRRSVGRGLIGVVIAIAGSCRVGHVSAQSATLAGATPCPPTTAESATAIARAYFDAFNRGDADALGALLADNYVHHGAVVAQQDRALHQQRMLAVRQAFPDGHYTIEDIIPEGDLVAIRTTFTGTQRGAFQAIPPTGKHVAIGAIHVHHIVCGKIVETWNSGDALGLLQQLGGVAGGPVAAPAGTPAASPVASPTVCPAGSPDDNRAVANRWFDDAVNPRDLPVFDQIAAPDAALHAASFPDEVGPAAIASLFDALYAGFSDLKFTVQPGPAAGDRVVLLWTAAGINDGEFQGKPATGKTATWTGINIYRIACGKIAEIWTEADTLGRLEQLGEMPPGATPLASPAA
jgi:steroid delta-isomerase-like uncharacterized protein